MPAATAYSLNDLITLTRASRRTIWDGVGALAEVANHLPGLTYDPVTLRPAGMLIEPVVTNYIRNPRMEGGSVGNVGSGGVIPSYWAISGSATPYAREIIGLGTESGIPYMDVRLSSAGTTAGAAADIIFENLLPPAAQVGDIFNLSAFMRVIAGAVPGAGITLQIHEHNSANAYVSGGGSPWFQPSAAPLSAQRYSHTATIANAAVAFARPLLRIGPVLGTPFDVTLRVGLPQFEKGTSFPALPVMPPVGSPAVSVKGPDGARLDLPKMGFANIGSSFVITATAFGIPSVGGGLLRVDDGSDLNYLSLYVAPGGALRIGSMVDGVGIDRQIGSVSVGQEFTVRVTFGPNYLRTSLDGAAAVTVPMNGYPLNLNRAYLGGRWNNGGALFCGTFRRFDLLPGAATEAELPTLSA